MIASKLSHCDSLYTEKVILYTYNFIFVLFKIKHMYNFKDSSYFQLIQKKLENRKRAQIRRRAYQYNRLEVESAVRGSVGHLVDSQSTSYQNTTNPSVSCRCTINHSRGIIMISKPQK